MIKGGPYVEAPARLRAIALDKTGTITRGKPSVVRIVPLEEHSELELLERAAALEAHSTHPLAVAVLEYAGAQGIAPRPVDGFRVIARKGAVGRFDGRRFWIGSHRYLKELKQETPEVPAQIGGLADAGHSVVVGNDRHVCGFIVLADDVRPTAIETIRKLRDQTDEFLAAAVLKMIETRVDQILLGRYRGGEHAGDLHRHFAD